MIKPYIKPKIKAVKLDPDQAILQICKSNGLYFTNSSKCISTNGTTGPAQCNQTVRGARLFDFFESFSINDIPS